MNESISQINDFVSWSMSMTSGSGANIEAQQQASTIFRILKINPNSLVIALNVIKTPDLPECAYSFASFIFRDRIHQPMDEIVLYNQGEIYEVLRSTIISHQGEYGKYYYNQYLVIFADFLLIYFRQKLTEVLPVLRPIQTFIYYQVLTSINCPYMQSFLKESEIETIQANSIIMCKSYIMSLQSENNEVKIGKEWIDLLTTIIYYEQDFFDFGVIITTIEYSIVHVELYPTLKEMLVTIFRWVPESYIYEITREQFNFYLSLARFSEIFTDKLIELDQPELLFDLWTYFIEYPIIGLIDLITDANNRDEQLNLFLVSFIKAITVINQISIQMVLDVIGKCHSLFDIKSPIMDEFVMHFLIKLMDLADNPVSWNYIIHQLIKEMFQYSPQGIDLILADHKERPGYYYLCSCFKIPPELVKTNLQILFSHESFPLVGLVYIKESLPFSLAFTDGIYQIFALPSIFEPTFFHYAQIMLMSIVKISPTQMQQQSIVFDFLEPRIITTLQSMVNCCSPTFNVRTFKDAFLILKEIVVLKINDDGVRGELCMFIKKSIYTFCQLIISQSVSESQLLGILTNVLSETLKELKEPDAIGINSIINSNCNININNNNNHIKNLNDLKLNIAAAINESIPDEFFTNFTPEAQQALFALVSLTLDDQWSCLLDGNLAQKYLSWIVNCLTNKFILPGHFNVLTQLFKIDVVSPPDLMSSTLASFKELNENDNCVIFQAAQHIDEILGSNGFRRCSVDFIWKYLPMQFIVTMITSQFSATNEVALRIMETLINIPMVRPEGFDVCVCYAFIIGFFYSFPSTQFDKAVEIIFRLLNRAGSDMPLKIAFQQIEEKLCSFQPIFQRPLHQLQSAFIAYTQDRESAKLMFKQFLCWVKMMNDELIQCLKNLLDTMY